MNQCICPLKLQIWQWYGICLCETYPITSHLDTTKLNRPKFFEFLLNLGSLRIQRQSPDINGATLSCKEHHADLSVHIVIKCQRTKPRIRNSDKTRSCINMRERCDSHLPHDDCCSHGHHCCQ